MKVNQLFEAQSVWTALNKRAKETFGKGFASLSEEDAATLVDMKKANKIAEKVYGEFGLMTCTSTEIRDIIEKNPTLIKK